MLMLRGRIVNTFETPTGTNRDTGETYGGQNRVQVFAEATLRNGEVKNELVDITVRDVSPFRELHNQVVDIPIGAFAPGETVRFFHAAAGKSPVNPVSS